MSYLKPISTFEDFHHPQANLAPSGTRANPEDEFVSAFAIAYQRDMQK
jgi:hypothetical protein